MLDESLPPDQAQEVVARKRSLWAQKGAAQEYQYEAYKPAPLTRLKNLVEIGFVMRYVKGALVLDAGAGTGRFTHPLRQRGLHVIPLDISREMLGEGRARANKIGTGFPCLQGEIERLPLRDNTFDSVISITVLRHFPNWQSILGEYVRVVRPGGRLIFEMVSADQRDFVRHISGGAGPNQSETSSLNDYQACVTLRELETLAQRLGALVQVVAPYDLFNENALLKHSFGADYDGFMSRLLPLLETQGGIGLYECVCRRMLPALSPAISDAWMAVLEKGRTNPSPHDGGEAKPQAAIRAPDALVSLVRSRLGDEVFEDALRELKALLALPGAEDLLELCRRELVPKFPVL